MIRRSFFFTKLQFCLEFIFWWWYRY